MNFIKDFIKTHGNKFLFSIAAALFLFFCYLILHRLGVHPYIDWDESIYGQVAKEMFLNKKFFDLSYFGSAWYEKPPLAFWLISAAYALGGVNEFAARLPSALASIGMVIISLRWLYELRKSFLVSIIAMSLYFIMFPFLTASYFVNLDSLVGFFAVFGLYAWWKAATPENKNSLKWFLIWGACIGLGVMTKNIVGLFILVPILIYTLAEKQFSILKQKEFWYGVALSLLIALPWHIYESVTVGKAFWENYLVYHVFDRFSTSLENNGAPWNYFLEIVFQRYVLAMVMFGGGLLLSAWVAVKEQSVRFLLISFVTLFIIFSSSITKLPSYITMTLPLLIMLAAVGLNKLIGYIPRKSLRGLVIIVLALSFLYTGYAFNSYKLTLGEMNEEYNSNKDVGEFLKDYKIGVPVYVNKDYKSLGIGYYAERKIMPTTDKNLIDGAKDKAFHRNDQEVFLGMDSNGHEYLLVKKY